MLQVYGAKYRVRKKFNKSSAWASCLSCPKLCGNACSFDAASVADQPLQDLGDVAHIVHAWKTGDLQQLAKTPEALGPSSKLTTSNKSPSRNKKTTHTQSKNKKNYTGRLKLEIRVRPHSCVSPSSVVTKGRCKKRPNDHVNS